MTPDEIFEAVKAGGDEGWKHVWENVIVPEMKSLRSGELARKYCITDGDLMGMLYEEMIGKGKIGLFRNDGGSLWGWMRQYVRGYVMRANPNPHGEFSIEGAAECSVFFHVRHTLPARETAGYFCVSSGRAFRSLSREVQRDRPFPYEILRVDDLLPVPVDPDPLQPGGDRSSAGIGGLLS